MALALLSSLTWASMGVESVLPRSSLGESGRDVGLDRMGVSPREEEEVRFPGELALGGVGEMRGLRGSEAKSSKGRSKGLRPRGRSGKAEEKKCGGSRENNRPHIHTNE